MAAEDFLKIGNAVISDSFRDLCDPHIAFHQKFPGLLNPAYVNVFIDGISGVLFENMAQITFAHKKVLRNGIKR